VEKRSHSRATKTKPYLVSNEDFASVIRSFNQDNFFNVISDESFISDFEDTPHVYKICSKRNIIISLGNKQIEEPCRFYGRPNNLLLCLELIKERLKVEMKSQSSKKEMSLDKKLNQLTSTCTLEAQSLTSSINLFLKESNEIDEVLSFLPTLLDYKNYQSLQLLFLRKGHSSAVSLELKDQNVRHETLKTNDYNHLFNLIKKSKNKSFDQSVILKKELNFVGTFLAKEMSIKEFQLIFIISRNDMFPATREEKKNFELVVELIAPHIYQLLKQKDLEKKIVYADEGLKVFPYPIFITDKKSNIIFSTQEPSHNKKATFPLKLDDSLTAHIEYPDSQNDFFADHTHHERIQLLGELLNTLKHELGNPLFGISLTTDLFDLEKLGQDSRTILQEISSNSSRCLKVIKNFSFLYQDTKTILPTQIEKLIHEVFTISKSETRQIKKKVVTSQLSHPEVLVVKTNPTLLTQVLFNLIINSAQSLKDQKGEKLISIEIACEGSSLILHVRDNGPGIPENMLHEVFKPFYTTKEKGTGLGLSICRRAMTILGGSIDLVQDSNQEGAHFILKLPYHPEEDSIEECAHN
jgi:two-component system NtrC family sensor kinase